MSGIDADLVAALDAEVDHRFEAEQVPWLALLVEQPSCTREPEDVERAAHILDGRAEALGLTVERRPDPDGSYADHRIYATEAATGTASGLALVGHVDTVFPRSRGFLGFARDGDVIRGPGVLDMKSGLSAVLFALEAVRAVSPDTWRSLAVRFVVNTDEELGSPSSHGLFRDVATSSRAALVFEAGREADRIVTRRKGTAVFHVEARGRGVHAGNHHADGVSAVHALALLVPELESLTDYARGVTVNVGLFEGGTAKNVVPAEAACVVDVRFEHAAQGDDVIDALERLCGRPLPGRLRDATIALRGGVSRPPLEATDDSQALREAYERHAGAVGLGVGEMTLQGGGSDANLLGAAGVPCIDGLGPWGRGAHTDDEWSSLSSLLKRTKALARFLACEPFGRS